MDSAKDSALVASSSNASARRLTVKMGPRRANPTTCTPRPNDVIELTELSRLSASCLNDEARSFIRSSNLDFFPSIIREEKQDKSLLDNIEI